MKVSEQKYTFESFLDELINNGLSDRERLRIVCYTTDEPEWGSRPLNGLSLLSTFETNAVEIKPLGAIMRLIAHYYDHQVDQNKAVTYYAFLDSTKNCFFVSRMQQDMKFIKPSIE